MTLSQMQANAVYKSVSSRYGEITVFANDSGAATQSLLGYGEWAENEITFLKQFAAEGSTVLDVGAYIGTHTLALARFVGPAGQLIAIEAQPDTFELLTKNVYANLSAEPPFRIQLLNAVASYEPAQISIPTINIERNGNFGSASLLGVLSADPTGRGNFPGHASVPAITVDSLDLQDCALIKIDVEGAEDVVLRGAALTVERCSPLVYCECNSLAAGLRSMAVLESLGYKIFAHVVDAFNAENFFRSKENMFGDAREVALVGVPAKREREISCLPLRDCELLLTIRDADDLVLALLNKPQYQGEVLRQGQASRTGGVRFLRDYDFSKLELDRLQRENAFLQRAGADERRLVAQHIQSITELRTQLARRDVEIADMQTAIAGGNCQIGELRALLSRRDADLARLQTVTAEAGCQIAELSVALTQRHIDISQTRDLLDQQEAAAIQFEAEAEEAGREIAELRDLLSKRDDDVAGLVAQGKRTEGELFRMHTSRSWRLTSPLRWLTERIRGTSTSKVKQ